MLCQIKKMDDTIRTAPSVLASRSGAVLHVSFSRSSPAFAETELPEIGTASAPHAETPETVTSPSAQYTAAVKQFP